MHYYSNPQTNYQMLVVNQDREQLALNSVISASFNCVYLSFAEADRVVNWVQEHQPDLIILNLKSAEAIDLQLITTLRIDWLTRNIPILMIADSASLLSPKGLDCDVYLNRLHSLLELEQTICSLVSVSACQSHGKAA